MRFSVFSFFCLFLFWNVLGGSASRADVVEITYMVPPNDWARGAWEKFEQEFNQTHTDVRLHIFWSALGPKINLLGVAGALPDLIADAHFRLATIHDKLIDLDDFLDQYPDVKAQYYPQLLEACRYHGSLKFLPIQYNLPFVYYRPDLFRKAGLPMPTPDWTWDDYRRDAKALTVRNPDGSVKMWGTNVIFVWWEEWLSLIRQAGGEAMSDDGKIMVDSDATRKAVQFLHDLIYVDKSAPSPKEAPMNGFVTGQFALWYGGHVAELVPLRREANFEWDIAPLPAGPACKATGELAVVGIGVSRQCKHPKEALEVLRFLLDKQVNMMMAEGGLTPPVRRDIAAATILAGTPETRTVPPLHTEVLTDSLAFARSVPTLNEWNPVETVINDGILHVLNDPDPAPIAALPAQLGAQCQVQLDLFRSPPTASPWLFVVQLLVLVAGAFWWLNRFLKKTVVKAEERAGQKYFFLFTAPCLAGLALFTLWPLLLSFWWAQTDYNMVDEPHYVGLAQYRALLFEDPDFWHSLTLSLIYAVFAVPLGLIVSLATALLLNLNLRHIGVFRVIFYLPSILPVAASSMMWLWLLEPHYGIVNRVLEFFGIPGPGWVQDPNWALPAIVLISTWGFGGAMLIFLAGLKNIPGDLYEAAEIDGAGVVSQFLHITLPSLSPVMFFNLTMGCIGALQVFDIAFIISTAGNSGNAPGGPEKSTDFYVLNLYVKSFTNLQIGAGSAMAWIFFLVIMFITAINFWARRYWLIPETERA